MTVRWTELLRRFVANRWALPTLLLTFGVLYRLVWLLHYRSSTVAQGEMANVAIAFARTGVLADAYRQGQGPTAHVLPIPPIYAGLIYRMFGIQSALSEALLAASAMALTLVAFVLLYRSFAEMGSSRTSRLIGLALVCLVPASFYWEVGAFRIWEGQLAAVTALLFLYGLLLLDRQPVIGLRSIVPMSLLAALLFLIHPPLGVAAYLCSLLCLAGRPVGVRWPATVAIAAAALVIVLAPWTIRNWAVFGDFIPLRSNAGLELALANHQAAATATDDLKAYRERLAEIHPFSSDAAYDSMQRAGGEVEYARQLGAVAAAWIVANPVAFAALCVKHFTEYFFPPTWEWQIYDDANAVQGSRLVFDRALHVVGLLGVAAALIRAPRRTRYAVIMIFVPALVYAATQPILRYRYLMYGLMCFFAADLIGFLLASWPPMRRWLVGSGIESDHAILSKPPM